MMREAPENDDTGAVSSETVLPSMRPYHGCSKEMLEPQNRQTNEK